MPKAQINPFNENLLTEEAAEAEEIGTGEAPVEQEAAPAEKPAQSAEPEGEELAHGPISPEKYGNVLQGLRAERERAKQAEKEAGELREKWARLEERQKVIREAGEQAQRAAEQQRQAAERPDPAVDPVGAELYDLKQARVQDQQALANLQAQLQNVGQNVQQSAEQAQFSNWVQATASQYSQQDPEYLAKATFAANKRMEFWSGLGATPEMARGIVEKESEMIARLAQQRGVNFAPIVAQLAQQWGYQGQAPVQQNGGAQQRLAQVAAGQKVQGLSRIPSSGPAQSSVVRNMTAAEMMEMTEAQFQRLISTPQGRRDAAYVLGGHEGVDEETMMEALKAS